MGSIAIKLRPNNLKNADLDLRCIIPDTISELTDDRIKPDGFDYLDDEYHTMVIFLRSDNPNEDVKEVLKILQSELFLENDIYEAGVVMLSANNDDSIDKYITVHP